MNDNKQIILLSLLLICSIGILIGYPTIKLLNDAQNKTEFKSNINSMVSELNEYFNSNTNFDNEYKIFTIKDYKIVEEGLHLNSVLPQNGYIYINKEGKTRIIANDESWCVYKDFNDKNITLGSCDDLTTAQLANQIIELSYSGDGLYSDYKSSYYYRGENPNNYIFINDEMYRIIEIGYDKKL